MIRTIIATLLVVFAGIVAAPQVEACNIPVFRYALENWIPDAYHVLAVSKGPLSEAEVELVETLKAASDNSEHPANLSVQTVDVEQLGGGEAVLERGEPGEEASDDVVPSWVLQRLQRRLAAAAEQGTKLVVLYPKVWDRVAWQAPLDLANVQRLIDSPARQTIAERLLDGQSAVWVLLECDDQAKNDAAWNTLVGELERIEDVVQLPARELIVAEDQYRADVEQAIELRVEFSALRIARDDDQEAAFASMLRGSEADLVEFDGEPVAVPVYGRGRTYFALVGKGINSDTVEENGHFICGACSCEVKRQNPGIDLLLAMNWDAKIGGSAMPDIVLPELTGVGGLEGAVSVTTDDTSMVDSALPSSQQVAFDSQAAAGVASSTAFDSSVSHANRLDDSSRSDPEPVQADDEYHELGDAPEFGVRFLLTVLSGVGIAVGVLGLVVRWVGRRLDN